MKVFRHIAGNLISVNELKEIVKCVLINRYSLSYYRPVLRKNDSSWTKIATTCYGRDFRANPLVFYKKEPVRV